MYQAITDFSRGINTNRDARLLHPYNDKDTTAEAVVMDNMDISKEGAMITSTGYSEVSHTSGTGGVLNLLNYDKDETNRYLLISYDDNHYSITPDASTWSTTNLGDYGTVATIVGGTVYRKSDGTRLAVLGNDISANATQGALISSAMADLTNAPDGFIMAVFMGRLFIASGTTLYYSNTDDETDWAGGGTIGFNDIITGLSVNGQRLTVLTRSYSQGVVFGFDDDFVIVAPQKEPYERPFGCFNFKTVKNTGGNTYYWGNRGVMSLGAEQGYDDNGIPRPMSLSKNIEPSLEYVNKLYRSKADSVYWENKQQYWLAVPYDTSQQNSLCLVYNENWKAWTTRSGFYPGAIELFKTSAYEEELYFGDANNPYLYKFDDSYSYDGNSYTRKWKSKIFTMGNGNQFKEFRRLDIAGAMDSGTEIDITIQVDNVKKTYRIDNSFLVKNSFSEYLGDNWLGDAYLGGEAPSESRFKRFYAPLDFAKEIREGLELQITIENDGEEQPFKIDFLGIDYEFRSRHQVPRSRYVNTQVNT